MKIFSLRLCTCPIANGNAKNGCRFCTGRENRGAERRPPPLYTRPPGVCALVPQLPAVTIYHREGLHALILRARTLPSPRLPSSSIPFPTPLRPLLRPLGGGDATLTTPQPATTAWPVAAPRPLLLRPLAIVARKN